MERVSAEVPFWLKIFDDFLEGKILMGVRAERSLSGPGQQLPKGGLTCRSHRNTIVLTKNPINPSSSLRVRRADRRSHRHVVLSAVATQ